MRKKRGKRRIKRRKTEKLLNTRKIDVCIKSTKNTRIAEGKSFCTGDLFICQLVTKCYYEFFVCVHKLKSTMYMPNDMILNGYLQTLSTARVLTQRAHQLVIIHLLMPRHLSHPWSLPLLHSKHLQFTNNSSRLHFPKSLIHSNFLRLHSYQLSPLLFTETCPVKVNFSLYIYSFPSQSILQQ